MQKCRGLKLVADYAIQVLLFAILLGTFNLPLSAQRGPAITWQPARAPFSPNAGQGAIAGGPGNDPNPGSPMYVCRAQVQGSLVPGKWVQGSCNVAFGNSEQVVPSYELAYGNARWGSYRGNTNGLIQTGNEADGSPLYSCRVRYVAGPMRTDYGYQPGKVVADGSCHFPMGGNEIVQNAPFEVLYGDWGGRPSYPNPPAYPPAQLQPLPPCRATDISVSLNQSTGHWEGPNCSPSDGFGNAQGPPKYPAPPPPPPYPGQGQQQPYQPPPPPYQPGPSSVSWQPAQSPFVPSVGAIMGGPGNGPKPGSPLFVCRASSNGALYPGKWIDGQCSITVGGQEQKVNTYEVANGNARWQTFDGNVGALVPGGYDADGTPLYICRIHYRALGDKGLQPGRLRDGQCFVPYAGSELKSGPPFEALYNVFSAPGPSQ
jgi:hypothetical protein